jgi:hypothetical protein
MKYVVALNMRRPVRFDHVAALLVGTLAILGAVLISLQMTHDHASGRAASEGSRLSIDLTTRGAVSSEMVGYLLSTSQQAAGVALSGLGRSMAALNANSSDDAFVGEADFKSAQQLQAEITAMSATALDDLDPYARELLAVSAVALTDFFVTQDRSFLASSPELYAELAEQNRQIDLADAESNRSHIAVLGLTFTALGGVLAGLGVALKETRPGWAILLLGWGVAILAIITAVMSAF